MNSSHFADGTRGAQRDATTSPEPGIQESELSGPSASVSSAYLQPCGLQPTPDSAQAPPGPCFTLSRYRSRISRPQLEQMFLPADGTEEAAEGGEQTEGVLGVQGEARPSSLYRAPARASASD